MFFTAAAAQKLGDKSIDQVAIAEVEAVNKSFRDSGVNGSLKLIEVVNTGFREEGCLYQDLKTLMSTNTPDAINIQNWRKALYLDVVILVVSEETGTCGVSGTYGQAGEAFAVVDVDCLGWNYSFARQIGSLAGCGNHESQSGRFNWFAPNAKGYLFITSGDDPEVSFNTIMGYTDEKRSFVPEDPDYDDYALIPQWSNPDVTWQVLGQQVPTGDAEHNNVAQLNSNFGLSQLANYKLALSVNLLFNFDLQANEVLFPTAEEELFIENVQTRKRSRIDILGVPRVRMKRMRAQKGSNMRILPLRTQVAIGVN